MEEYVYSKSNKYKNVKILVVFAIVIFAFVLVYQYSGMIFSNPREDMECIKKLGEWCDECFTANDYSFDSWTETGNVMEADVMECSRSYSGSELELSQGCVGLQELCIGLI